MKEVIRRGACYKIGNDWSIDVRSDPWLPWAKSNLARFKEGQEAVGVNRVANLISQDLSAWNSNTLGELFSSEVALGISKLDLPSTCCEDKLCWLVTENGRFSVKSCFEVLQNLENTQENDNF